MQTELKVKRPNDLPRDLRIVRHELTAMEYCGTPSGQMVCSGWQLVVFGDPHAITDTHKAALKAAGWIRFFGRNAGTYRRKITVRFEG